MKITPGHDQIDHQVGRRQGLQQVDILDDEGRMAGAVPSQFAGMPRFTARNAVRSALTDLGLYQGEEDHAMVLPVCRYVFLPVCR